MRPLGDGTAGATLWLEDIADAAYRLEALALSVGQFVPHIAYVDVHHVGLDHLIVALDTVEDCFAPEYLTRMTHEALQQIELARREGQGAAATVAVW